MLIRISLILAILAAAIAGALNISLIKDKINTLTVDRNTQRDGRIAAEGERDSTKKQLVKTEANLKQTTQDLADANTERQKAVATAAAQSKRAEDLADKLTKTAQDLADTQTKLAAYVATGKSAEDVGKLGLALKDSQEALEIANEEKLVLLHTVARLTNELAKFTGDQTYVVKLRADLRGKILVVDPKWDFVVLNIGEDQGVIEDGELLVSREGKLVAKVVVRSVEKDRCIANVVPGWKLGEVIEGDEVSPAHPAS